MNKVQTISGNSNERDIFNTRNFDYKKYKNLSNNATLSLSFDHELKSNSPHKESLLNNPFNWNQFIQILKKIISCNNLPELCLEILK